MIAYIQCLICGDAIDVMSNRLTCDKCIDKENKLRELKEDDKFGS
jgi:predicted nucleic acid-binding Zn ribbon protein